MTSPIGWDEAAADIIARDGDMEEPPVFQSGHEAFLRLSAAYDGWADLEAADE